ncbi:MAG: hypothetical protein IPG60_15725 [Bacteroidetes bacterium]|nr:hypothetical protein [Bacteroidota bacterium]
MDTYQRYWIALYFWVLLAVIILPLLIKVRAPYGRHIRSGWGKMIDNHLGWFWMEVPALLVFPLFVFMVLLKKLDKLVTRFPMDVALYKPHFNIPFSIAHRQEKNAAYYFNNGCCI